MTTREMSGLRSQIVRTCSLAAALAVTPAALRADELETAVYPGLFAFADAKGGDHGAGHGGAGLDMSPEAKKVPFSRDVFKSDPRYEDVPYDAKAQEDIYGAKYKNATQRPLLELGREMYNFGPLQKPLTFLGETNPVEPQFLVFGDFRTAIAYNDNGVTEQAIIAARLNLDLDLKITSTERIHAFIRPLDKNNSFSRIELGGTKNEGTEWELDGNLDTIFFEGDVGSVLGGFSNTYSKFDMPITLGIIPLLFQNGVWVEDAFAGMAITLPAMHSTTLDISNFDITFFAAWDRVTTDAVPGANHGVHLYGVTTFIEASEGYYEFGYGYIDDNTGSDLSYHNFTGAFTKRYFGWLSNSIRVVAAVGQDPAGGAARTADGVILLLENSFITENPSTVIPYVNFFLSKDRPQSLARDAGAGGILKNTGILFETDGLTGFPKMDDTGRDVVGFAAGLELLFNLDKQLVFEIAGLRKHGNDASAPGDQLGFGVRFQIPINNAMIFRVDAMYAIREDADNLSGIRAEYRFKF